MATHDTIIAISTPRGRAALGVIRLSGPDAKALVEASFESDESLQDRRPVLRLIRDSQARVLDQSLVCFFKAPKSFTGEDLVELSCHGNPQILEAIVQHFVSRGTRLAEPGEFSRRAVSFGKMSLQQLEALDLSINSRSRAGARLGIRALSPGFNEHLHLIRQKLLDLRLNLEASLDFSEEEVGDLNIKDSLGRMNELSDELASLIRSYESIRSQLGSNRVLLLGPPNSGKSSLFNHLLGHERALVFDQPGTTRDVLEAQLESDRFSIVLIDSAGLRNEADSVEQMGIKKSLLELKRADKVLWISQDASPPPESLFLSRSKDSWIFVKSKSDLGGACPENWIPCSIYDSQQIKRLEALIFDPKDPEAFENTSLVSERQFFETQKALLKLQEAKKGLLEGQSLDLVAQSLLEASFSLGEVFGEIKHEELLNSILARFCIGK
jgi:tRNA modification GTPase